MSNEEECIYTEINELFGVSKENAVLLGKNFEHLMIDNPDIRDFVKALNIDTGGNIAYLAYLLGRHSEQTDRNYKSDMIIEGLMRIGEME